MSATEEATVADAAKAARDADRALARDAAFGTGEMADAVAASQVERIGAHVAARRTLQDARESGDRIPAESQREVFDNSRLNLGAVLGDRTAIDLVSNVLEDEYYGMYRRFREAPADSPEGKLRASLIEKHGTERGAWNERRETLNFSVQRQSERGNRIGNFETEILGVDPNSYAVLRTPNEEKASLKYSIRKEFRVNRLGDEFCDFYDQKVAAPAGIAPLVRGGKDEQGRNKFIDRAYLDFDVTVVGVFEHVMSSERNANGNLVPREGRSTTHIEPVSDNAAAEHARSAIQVPANGDPGKVKELAMRNKSFVDAHGMGVPVKKVLDAESDYNPEDVAAANRHAKGYKVQAMSESFPGNAAVFNANALVSQLNRALGVKAFDPVARYEAESQARREYGEQALGPAEIQDIQAKGKAYARGGMDPTPQLAVSFRRDGTLSGAVNRPVDIGRFSNGGALNQVLLNKSPRRETIRQLASGQGRGVEADVAPDPDIAPMPRSAGASPSAGMTFSLPTAPAPAAEAAAAAGKGRGKRGGAKDGGPDR
jgi:hypothetical protein